MASGILHIIFTSGFAVITFAFAFYYWEKKRYRLAVGWFVAMWTCLAAGAFFYYLSSRTNPTSEKRAAPGRPYIVIRDSLLEPPTAGKRPILSFSVENTGTVETEGYFRDVTCRLIDWGTPRFLTYFRNDNLTRFSLAPGEKHILHTEFGAPVFDDYLIKMLNEGKVGLYLFGRGEYSDESGRHYPVSFCQQYTTVFANHLALCDDSITFREPEESEQ